MVVGVVCWFREDNEAVSDNVADAFESSVSISDFTRVATLGVGGFGRVELVCMSCLHCSANQLGTLNAEQRTTRQYGDWYTGRWWVGCYIWYSEETTAWAGCGPAQSPPRCRPIPDITAYPSTASVPTSYYSMWHYNCHFILEIVKSPYLSEKLSDFDNLYSP